MDIWYLVPDPRNSLSRRDQVDHLKMGQDGNPNHLVQEVPILAAVLQTLKP